MSALDEFINDLKDIELNDRKAIQEIVARHFTEEFEQSGTHLRRGIDRRSNALITGAAAALARGNGGEIIPTEEIIRRHNASHPRLRIPINRITRGIPSGMMEYVSNVMYQRSWTFAEFMGDFGNYVIMYSSIAGGISVNQGWNAIALMCSFLVMLVLSQGMQYTTERGRDGRVNQRRIAMTANWATPDPQPDKTLIENCRKNDDKQQTRNEYIIRQTHWFGPDKVTESEGYNLYAGSNALQSRVEIEGRPVMILYGMAGSVNSHEEQQDQPFLVFRGDPPQPVEKDTSNYIRCRAIKNSDGKRCVKCLHIRNHTGFCGTHSRSGPWAGEVADNDWAVDVFDGASRTQGPSRVVEFDKNNLKF